MTKISDQHKHKIRKKVSNRRKTRPFSPPKFPDSIVLEYGKALIQEINKIDVLLKEILFPHLDRITDTKNQRLDSNIKLDLELRELAGVGLVAELMRRIKSKFYGEIIGEDSEPSQRLFTRSMRRVAKKHLDRTKVFTEKKFVAEFKRQTGVEPLPQNLAVDEFVRDATIKNINLIKTLPTRYLSSVQAHVEEAVNRGQLTREVKKEILKIRDATKNQARLIARDQTAKLTGVLNESRQRKLGIENYIWVSQNDSRVRSLANTNGRSSHAHLNGTLQKWSEPPQVVFKGARAGTRLNPSEDFQCRCFATPDYSGITGLVHPDVAKARKKSISLGLIDE